MWVCSETGQSTSHWHPFNSKQVFKSSNSCTNWSRSFSPNVPTNKQIPSLTNVVRRHLLPEMDGQSLVVNHELDTCAVTWPLAQSLQTLLGLELPFITCEHLCNLPTAISPGRREASSWGRRWGRSRCGCSGTAGCLKTSLLLLLLLWVSKLDRHLNLQWREVQYCVKDSYIVHLIGGLVKGMMR